MGKLYKTIREKSWYRVVICEVMRSAHKEVTVLLNLKFKYKYFFLF